VVHYFLPLRVTLLVHHSHQVTKTRVFLHIPYIIY
jgi:hypothetical protein